MQGLSAVAIAGLLIAATSDRAVTPISDPVGMSDDQLAGARVITGFPGHHPPRALRRMISAGLVAGVVLFGGTVGGPRQVRWLTGELRVLALRSDVR